ncbi:hypothetical protein [Rubellicoccus peritrichatus]|uniref:Uncharacterized protein n=1 Tax=Rubellicoccus peritrichatus TaxID=3080537 RepID=A0AAQ3QTT1_9BACT|nr:hypothetical protein [Puniceicoccus sp. CR14]WOO39723.1 hypothetical protein RZN69_13955 [Puniceicoccus sp. CR14]
MLSIAFHMPSVVMAAAEENIQAAFSCVSWEKPIKGLVYVRSNGEMVPLRIHNKKRSVEIDYHGSNPIIFYRKNPSADAEGDYQPIAQVLLRESYEQPLFFFLGKEGAYSIVTMEDSFESYPTGSYRFYNFTERDLVAKLGDETLSLAPQEAAYLEKPFSSSMEYPVAFVVRDSDGVRPLYTNMWAHAERFRYLILISKSDVRDTGSMSFRILSDYE